MRPVLPTFRVPFVGDTNVGEVQITILDILNRTKVDVQAKPLLLPFLTPIGALALCRQDHATLCSSTDRLDRRGVVLLGRWRTADPHFVREDKSPLDEKLSWDDKSCWDDMLR